MAETLITCEIASAIRTALLAVVPDGTTIYCDGVPDNVELDQAAANGEEEPVKMPCVSIVVSECVPMQYRSVLRAYPVMLEAATWQPEDKDQRKLYALGQALSLWLCEPTLTLTLAHWDALVIETEPARDNTGRIQTMTWTGKVKTRKA